MAASRLALAQAHRVVVRHGALGAEVGQCDQRRVVGNRQHRAGQQPGAELAVGRNIVGDAESVTRDAVEEVALDGFGRCIGDGVHQAAAKPFPVGAEVGEQCFDLGVVCDVAGKKQRAVEFGHANLVTAQESGRSGR